MSNQYINIYKGNPTAGAVDGTAVSTDGTFTAPVSVVLDVASSEAQSIKLAIRSEAGCKTQGDTIIRAAGASSNRWQFCSTENGTYDYTLTISSEITATNTVFYARVIKEPGESLNIDRSVCINVQTVLIPI